MLEPKVVKDLHFQLIKGPRAASDEKHFEFRAVDIFRTVVALHASDVTRSLPPAQPEQLRHVLAETNRQVHKDYRLAILSDGQTAYAIPELHALGLAEYFEPVLISGQVGYRKPDERLFRAALAALQLEPSQVLFVGNDMHRDVYGAQRAGMKTVFLKSNQGTQEREGVKPDYIIYHFAELLAAIRFFEGQAARLPGLAG